jgi:DNA-binding NarL/FixJ family response regulator
MARIRLSALELAILKALAKGMQSKEIAEAVDRSKATVEAHVRVLLLKYDARSRPHLVGRAIFDGAIGASDLEIFDGDTRP